MHFVKINIFVFHDDRNMTIVIETLIDANTTRILKLITKEIVYMKWLKKIVLDENEQINVVLKFIFVETINVVTISCQSFSQMIRIKKRAQYQEN
jgi:hypothetical protein